MDPYLEGHLWTTFHAYLATAVAWQLLPRLRPKYIAMAERKYLTGLLEDVLVTAGSMVPDVGVRKTGSRSPAMTGTALPSAPVRMRSRVPTTVPHYRINIRDTKTRKLVTAIELLSPTNKSSGRKQYLRKRQRFLRSPAHLLEIDLHHQGKRVPLLDPYPPGAYFVLLSRARKRSVTELWPIPLDEPLPTVPVPLLKGDPDVPLNLQEAFTKVYDEGGLDLVVDYRQPPDVDLPPQERAWLDQYLRDAGWR
jgi:hypothetical protein